MKLMLNSVKFIQRESFFQATNHRTWNTNKDGKLNTNDLILITNDINNYEKKDDLISEIGNFIILINYKT